MISLMKQVLFIHPLPSHLAQDYWSIDGGQPHLIYRRALHDVIGQGCDVSGKITLCARKVQSFLCQGVFVRL